MFCSAEAVCKWMFRESSSGHAFLWEAEITHVFTYVDGCLCYLIQICKLFSKSCIGTHCLPERVPISVCYWQIQVAQFCVCLFSVYSKHHRQIVLFSIPKVRCTIQSFSLFHFGQIKEKHGSVVCIFLFIISFCFVLSQVQTHKKLVYCADLMNCPALSMLENTVHSADFSTGRNNCCWLCY